MTNQAEHFGKYTCDGFTNLIIHAYAHQQTLQMQNGDVNVNHHKLDNQQPSKQQYKNITYRNMARNLL